MSSRNRIFTFVILAAVLMTSGCNNTPAASTETPQPTAEPATATPSEPTPTPAPLAAIVNGEGILLSNYEAELQRLQASQAELGQTSTPEQQRQQVLDALIEKQLLSQAAYKAGFTLDDDALQARIDELTVQAGGPQALADWQAKNFYTDETFRADIRLSAAAAFQRDAIANSVPSTAEQVHARQILVSNLAAAEEIVAKVKSGSNFASLASQYDPATGGDLGWFPRGYLLQPLVEEAAFGLQAGEISAPIQTSYGYHVIQVIERDPSRALTSDMLREKQRNAVTDWLVAQRSQSTIEILIP